jgi:hypothetical protein
MHNYLQGVHMKLIELLWDEMGTAIRLWQTFALQYRNYAPHVDNNLKPITGLIPSTG